MIESRSKDIEELMAEDEQVPTIQDIDEEEAIRSGIKWFVKMNPSIIGLRFHDMHPYMITKMKDRLPLLKLINDGVKRILNKYGISGEARLDYYNYTRSLQRKLRCNPKRHWHKIADAHTFYYMTMYNLKSEAVNDLMEFILALVIQLEKYKRARRAREYIPYVPKKPWDINNPDVKVEPGQLYPDDEKVSEILAHEEQMYNDIRRKLMSDAAEAQQILRKIEEYNAITKKKIDDLLKHYEVRENAIMDFKLRYQEPLGEKGMEKSTEVVINEDMFEGNKGGV